SASTSDLSAEAIQETVKAALNIARYTAEDEAAGLPEKELLATQFDDLELHHPWAISSDEAVDLALQIEASALEFSDQVSNSEGPQVDTAQGRFILANSLGFLGGYASTRHIVSASVIAGQAEQ